MVRAFKKDGAGAWQLWREYVVGAITPSASVATFRAIDDEIGEVLETGFQIGFSTHNAEGFNCHVSGGDF
jgi:ABC-type polysaccharide transport system permease subunit